jgi:CheY-like chemotaxis protein
MKEKLDLSILIVDDDAASLCGLDAALKTMGVVVYVAIDGGGRSRN